MNLFEKQIHDFTEYLKLRKQSLQTIEAYTYHVGIFCSWCIKKKIFDLREVTEEIVKEYQKSLYIKKYSLHTHHIKLKSVKRFFEFLESTQNLLYNPCERILFPALGKRLPENILTFREMEKLLNTPNTGTPLGIRDKTILELLYSTGIRRSECCHLTVNDIDFTGGYLRVNRGKGAKDRILPVGKKACQYVKEYIMKVRPLYTKKNPDERTLFIAYCGTPLSSQSLMILVRKYGRYAKIKKPVTVHAIRRAFATHMLKNGAHPLYIQRLLGHEKSETIRKYIRVTAVDIKKTHKKTHPREKDRK